MSPTDHDAQKAQPELISFFYDLALLEYCGLTTPGMGAEIQRQQIHLKNRLEAQDKDLDIARTIARKNAYEEWNNRGVGGFAHWCNTQGQRALKRFTPDSG